MATLTNEQREDRAVAAALAATPTNPPPKAYEAYWWHLTQYGLQYMCVESLEPVTSTGVLLHFYSKMIFKHALI